MTIGSGMSNAEYNFCEDVSSISINFGASPKYDKAMERAANVGGSADFYRAAIDAAIAMKRVEKKLKIEWGGNAEWPLTIDALSEAILDYAIKDGQFPSIPAIEKLAEESIDWN